MWMKNVYSVSIKVTFVIETCEIKQLDVNVLITCLSQSCYHQSRVIVLTFDILNTRVTCIRGTNRHYRLKSLTWYCVSGLLFCYGNTLH